jgi:hypothetical protein
VAAAIVACGAFLATTSGCGTKKAEAPAAPAVSAQNDPNIPSEAKTEVQAAAAKAAQQQQAQGQAMGDYYRQQMQKQGQR